MVDRVESIDLGQRHRGNHLGAHAGSTGRCGGDQPLACTWTERQEGGLVWRPRPGCAMERTLWWRAEVRRIVARLTRHGRFPARDLVRTMAADVNDDDLIVVLPHPDLLASVVVGHRVLATFELDDRQVLTDAAGHAEDGSERVGWQWMQTLLLLSQPLDRRAAGGSVWSRIDPRTELIARGTELT